MDNWNTPLFIFTLLLIPCYSTLLPDRFLKSIHLPLRRNDEPQQYLEVTNPLPQNPTNPNCSLLLLHHDFADTIGKPPIAAGFSTPADCPAPWTRIILEFQASCKGEQYDRIAGIWISGVEVLRTSTAEPTEWGVFWTVRKDITRYASLFLESNLTLTVMLENLVDQTFTGIYHVNISVHFYEPEIAKKVSENLSEEPGNLLNLRKSIRFRSDELARSTNPQKKLGVLTEALEILSEEQPEKLRFEPEESAPLIKLEQKSRFILSENPGFATNPKLKLGFLYEEPADLIIPISGEGSDGFWFKIENESDVGSKTIEIPLNTYRAALEIYVSFHFDDEFWYSNPPNSYILRNNLTTRRGNGAFRQVFARIDGLFAGSIVPFPVIFTGGINPLFWEPVVAIGAFDLPSYDLDMTPFLGFLLDGKPHIFSVGVTDSIPYWLVDANLHLWLDQKCSHVNAKLNRFDAPVFSLSRDYDFEKLDGEFKIKGESKIYFSGWVNSSLGNLTTHINQQLKYKNNIKFTRNGSFKTVEQKVKVITEVKVEGVSKNELANAVYTNSYPLYIITSRLPQENNTYILITNLTNSWEESSSLNLPDGASFRSVADEQDAGGWMLVQDHDVLDGTASIQQTYLYKDDNGSYSRHASVRDGKLSMNNSTYACILSL